MATRAVGVAVCFLGLFSCFARCQREGPDPGGRNVCQYAPGLFRCCDGWSLQAGRCSIAKCEGNFTCVEREVCVRPNECRCRHGYFGATCDTKCPALFWGPECKGRCTCYPYGHCDDVTGSCTCLPNRWGEDCELSCGCQKGTCNQETGVCTCYPGFWGKQCSKSCLCSANSVCSAASGQCSCNPGWYGRNCNAQCACNGSPCDQLTGRCKCRERLWGSHCERMCQCIHGRCNQTDGSCTCRPGFRGKLCREPCPAGFYGQNCRNRCGHCKGQQPCKVMEGHCVTCEPGWNGTRCDQMCVNGFFGENCQESCPSCKDGHFCNRVDGKCSHCNPGGMGDRCEVRCPRGTYGENCANKCKDCFNGTCHFVTGNCLCEPGFHGAVCNMSCSAGKYGVDCAHACYCHENNCDPVTGACILQTNQRMGVMAAGVLVSFLFLLLLSMLCCCYLCKHNNIRGSSEQEEEKTRNKQRLCGRFTRISSKLPRVPLRRQKLPNILVTHHDTENTFNCSFIEPPSTAEQLSPPGSSRGSYCSAQTTEDGHACSDRGESVKENKSKGDRINQTVTTLLGDEDDLSETEATPEDPHPDPQSSPGSASGALLPQPSRRPGNRREIDGGDSCFTDEKTRKPRPPDPSSRPKTSWIHQSGVSAPNRKARADAVPGDGKDAARKAGARPGNARSTSAADKAGAHAEREASRNPRAGFIPLDQFNGAVQNVWGQMRKIGANRNPDAAIDYHLVKTPASFNALRPHATSETTSPFAAQLKEKTQANSPAPPAQWTLGQTGTSHLDGAEHCPALTSGTLPDGHSTPKEVKIPISARGNSESLAQGATAVKKTAIKKPKRKREGRLEGRIDSERNPQLVTQPRPEDLTY